MNVKNHEFAVRMNESIASSMLSIDLIKALTKALLCHKRPLE